MRGKGSPWLVLALKLPMTITNESTENQSEHLYLSPAI
jgi:hypothetical protein